jgi:murein tripeptide amidase MpaA
MVNVDGVILGNFRTSISGRDLNRVFDQPQNYQEVGFIR